MTLKYINTCIMSFTVKDTIFLHVRLANIKQITTHHVGEGQTNSHFHIFSMAGKTDLTSVESTSAKSGKIHVPFDPEIPLMRIFPITTFIIYDISHTTGFTIAFPHALIQYLDFGNNLSTCLVLSHVQLFVTPRTATCQAPLSMGFSRQDYWSGCHFLLQGIFPTQGSNLHLLCLLHSRRIFYPLSRQGSPTSTCS